jgi:hypothetical protein
LGSEGSGTVERFPKKGAISGTVGCPVAARRWKPLEFRRIAVACGTAPPDCPDGGIPMKSQSFLFVMLLSQHAESATHAQITARTWLSIRPFDNFIPDDFICAPLNRS